jgi:hypothetical protein
MPTNRVILYLAFCLIIFTSPILAEVPQVINYQGCLTDTLGDPVPDGVYTLMMTIYTSAAGDDDIWWCREVPVDVKDGLFNCHIGEACQLPHNMFANDSGLYLGIALSGGSEMEPRTKLTSTAFAYHALRADTAEYVSAGAAGWVDDGSVVRLDNVDDSVGIGTTTPQTKLDVEGGINAAAWYFSGGNRILSDSGNGIICVGQGAGEYNIGTWSTFIGAYAGRHNEGANNVIIGRSTGYYNTTGMENTFVGQGAGYSNETGNENTFVGQNSGYNNVGESQNTYIGMAAGNNAHGGSNTYIGKSAGGMSSGSNNVFIGYMAGYNEDNSNRLYINNTSSSPPLIYGQFTTGTVGIGTITPSAKLHAFNESGTAIKGESNGLMPTAIKGLTGSSGGTGVTGDADGFLGTGIRGYARGLKGIGVYGSALLDSSYGVYGTASGAASCGVYGEVSEANSYGVRAKNNYWGGHAMYAEATGPAGIGIEAIGGPGGYAAKFTGNVILYSQEDGQTILELGEGLDYAEGFDVSENGDINPGTVVIIDPDNPGKLAVSNSAYDSKVAGIVAGADGLGSGVRLGGDRFDHDIALAGRVYCNVDATNFGIEPGDLLTTSSSPGFAMKAINYNRARGAILGKAMQSMEKGQKGKILVLVTLQ